MTFIGQEGVGRQCARHGGQNALMKALDRPSRPYAICISSNLLANQGGKVMLSSSGLHRLEPVLINCGGGAIEDVCGPQNCRYNRLRAC